jgi:hypothetical protein
MKQSEEYRSRHSMEVPGKSTEVPGGCTEVPDNCQELPWSRKKPLYGSWISMPFSGIDSEH